MHHFFKNYGSKVKDLLVNLSDPCIGKHLVELQKKTFISRVDGRSPEHFLKQGGLIERISALELKEVRFSRVEKYQKYNENPFAWGACPSILDLAQFVNENQSNTENAWIHKFYGKATSLFLLKYETGIESESFDYEKEHLILETIPFSQFLVSIDPKFQKKFLNGSLVPNKMAELSPDLPKTVRFTDLQSDTTILLWLIRANSHAPFANLCKIMYSDKSEQKLHSCFKESKEVYNEVKMMLSQEHDNISLRNF
jgi:hypothetical protein